MNPRWLLVLGLACTLTACGGGGPVKRVHPSTASIQQLAVQADGVWRITLRIQNYSTTPMHYSALDAKLSIAGVEAGRIGIVPDIDIVGSSGDVVETTLKTSAKIPSGNDFAYELKGHIQTSEPKGSFPFTTSSRLSPVPGIANTYR
ncbi:MAG: LEA type 2 family protein [Rhodanobacter sp.]|jgi:hypothetical protein|nr:LEA type 2 family protein [Rhodanobacter sp.]